MQYEGGVEWQIQHKLKPSAVFTQDPTPSTVFSPTSQVNGALTDLLFCVHTHQHMHAF